MAVLGDTGTNHPDNWVGGLGGPQLHAIAILFARDEAARERSVREHNALLARTPGVEALSSLDLEAIPFRYVREHFGYRDRLTTPQIEGTGIEPTPGSGPPIKAGEFILGYPDEDGPPPKLPQPELLSRNGSYMAYRRLQQHVGEDTGTGATLGAYISRISAVGPEVGVLFPVGQMQGSLNLRGYWEFAAQNRSSGWNTWLVFSIAPPSEKTPKVVK